MISGGGRRAILFNDTSSANHHGCRLVVATIRSCLAARGIDVIASAATGASWWKDDALINALRRADVVVVNGEGTLHHGSAGGDRLLRAVEHAASLRKPVALINTIYQDNPPDWARRLHCLSYMATRDRRSLKVAKDAGFVPDYAPDLSFYGNWPAPASGMRTAIAYGDSVYRETTRQLLNAFRDARGSKLYLPIRTSIKHAGSWPLTLSQRLDNLRYALRVRFQSARSPERRIAPSVYIFLCHLSQARLYLTGRYHAVCLSLVNRTPFRAIASNSFKIEALLDDAGLNPARIANTMEDLTSSKAANWQFSPDEEINLEFFLKDARQRIDSLFDRVAAL